MFLFLSYDKLLYVVNPGERKLTIMEEFRREPTGVVGSEFSEELAFRSSELRLSEPSLKPLLMELLSSHLQTDMDKKNNKQDF